MDNTILLYLAGFIDNITFCILQPRVSDLCCVEAEDAELGVWSPVSTLAEM